jgi:hypothetical protein
MECLVGIIGVLVAAFILIRRGRLMGQKFLTEGITTEAEVLMRRRVELETGSICYVTCRYIVDGITYDKEVSVLDNIYDSLISGRQTQVVYLSTKPKIVRHISSVDRP